MLAKVPCLLLATAGFHVTYTSPNPPASAESRASVSSLADRILMGILGMRTLEYVKVRAKKQYDSMANLIYR